MTEDTTQGIYIPIQNISQEIHTLSGSYWRVWDGGRRGLKF